MLPEASHGPPSVVSAGGAVTADSVTWIVTAGSFRATETSGTPQSVRSRPGCG